MRKYIIFKKILDLLFAALLLVLVSPIMACVAILVKIGGKGPVFFRQKRTGKGNRIFTIYKFRTMRVETEENGKRIADLERISKVGQFLRNTSIDELPQLFNVIRGEMSFIGPRPLLVEYLDYYSPLQMRRHEVLPGITGWAQINGRNSISWEEKFNLDVWYVDNQSFLLDLKIFWLTLLKVFKSENINQPGQATVEYFKGSKEVN